MPDPCLDGYFKFLLKHPSHSAEALQHGIATDDIPAARDLQRPVRDFLSLGGEFAVEYLDRSIALLHRLAASNPRSAELEGLCLAGSVVEAARNALDDSCETRLTRRFRGSQLVPMLALDVNAGDIRVDFPEVESDDGSATWHVAFEGQSAIIVSEDDWSSSAAPESYWSIPRPVAALEIACPDGGAQTVRVVDSAIPLIVFDRQGAALPLERLRGDQVWIAHPADRDIEHAEGMRECAEIELTMRGWSGWRLRLVDLANARSIGLSGCPRVLSVAGDTSRPQLEVGSELLGITCEGHVVYSTAPQISLPDGATDGEWLVEVSEVDVAGQSVSRAAVPEKMWDEFERPLLGRYTVAVRGPLGRGLRERDIVVAEGLAVSYSVSLRRLRIDGLEPATAIFSAPEGFHVEPRRSAELPCEVVGTSVTVRGAGRSLALQVEAPHMAVQVEGGDAAAGWSVRPLRLDFDAFLDDPGLLRVRTAALHGNAELILRENGRLLQEISTSARNGVHSVDLRRFTDTLRGLSSAEFFFREHGHTTPVLQLIPGSIANGVDWTEAGLELRGVRRRLTGVTASIAPSTAPWLSPTTRVVSSEGRVLLGDPWRGYGPLRVNLRITDPWASPEDEPTVVSGPFIVQAPGCMPTEDEDEAAVSRLLIGGPFPIRIRDFVPLWHALAEDLNGPFLLERWIREVRQVARAAPADAMADLGDADLRFEDQVRLLVASGLAADFHEAEPDFAEYLWPIAPAMAVLKGGLRQRQCRNAARRACGGDFESLLLNPAEDRRGHTARFDLNTNIIARIDEEALAKLGRNLDPPMPLLSAHSRRAAALQLASVHRDPRLADARSQGAELVSQILRTIGPYLARHMQKRKHPSPTEDWHYLAWLSAGFALLARQGAHGDDRCRRLLEQHHRVWSALARCAPRIVTIDLVVAELLLTGMEIR